MKFKLLLILTIVVLGQLIGFGFSTKQKHIVTSVQEKVIDYDLGFLSIPEDYPEWDPYSTEKVPVSRKEAIKIAENEIKRGLQLDGEWKADKIVLEKYDFTNYWIYVITMSKTIDDLEKVKKENPNAVEAYHIIYVDIPVLLNGIVPARKIYDEAGKS